MTSKDQLEKMVMEYREARDKRVLESIVLSCYPMMEHLAEKKALRHTNFVEISDLIGYGIIGLLKSIDSYEPGKGAGFGTYAYIRVQGAMQDGLRSIDWMSNGARKKAKFLDRLYSQIIQKFMRTPSHEEMAQALNITMREFGKVLQEHSRTRIYSLESTQIENYDLVDPTGDPVYHLIERETQNGIREAINSLPAREKVIIEMHYYRGMSLTDISKSMEVSLSCISRLHKRAINRLRNQQVFIDIQVEGDADQSYGYRQQVL
ncbi:MAG: sigma-70 family RNA polymerase sigma factor [Firmicutes bacterium]|nr:sigma-70 family RNA polymerase sigma factor [Bacillota bacterium]